MFFFNIWSSNSNVCNHHCKRSYKNHNSNDKVSKIKFVIQSILSCNKSSFFWLISLLISALLWFVVVPLRDKLLFALVFSVFFQEAFRYLFYLFIKKSQKGLERVQKNIHHKDRTDFDSRVISYGKLKN